MSEQLGRFGHHPDPATDFCVEVEEIQSIHTNQGLGLTGMGHEADYETVDSRIAKAMSFRVGGDEYAVKSKALLREIEAKRKLVHRVGWEISNAAVEEMRAQGFSGGWDHDALANNIAAAAIRATGADAMRDALQHYADTYCEGWCKQKWSAPWPDCGGCLARTTLAELAK